MTTPTPSAEHLQLHSFCCIYSFMLLNSEAQEVQHDMKLGADEDVEAG